ncbi:MAG: hypothetical protein QM626_02205 [Microbacterium sp.]|uniref:hypothetical protein n=1 Tax=Microbacterium sp. TaxID=51671 RepID=UPI0039E71BAD
MTDSAMDRNLATDEQRLAGIVAQVSADTADADDVLFEHVLRQRLDQAGVGYDDAVIAAALAGRR